MILAAVVGAKSGVGLVKVSALKQFGLMDGDSKGYFATPLAKSLAGVPSGEEKAILATAALSPPIFKKCFDTYHGDSVSRGKLRQRFFDLGVHPDLAEKCTDIYVDSLILAGLVTEAGDLVTHQSASSVAEAAKVTEGDSADATTLEQGQDDQAPDRETVDEVVSNPTLAGSQKPNGMPTPRAIFNVNVTLDSSLDIEKLAKQLETLKKYGAI